jgi:hypothetical protein
MDGPLEANLRSSVKLGTARSVFNEILATGVAGPELEDIIKSNFGLRSDLKYRFVEKAIQGRRLCLLFGYDRQTVHDIKWVTFDERLPLHFVPVESPLRNAEQLNRLGLQQHQEAIAVPTRLNGKQQFVLFIRDGQTGRVEQITMASPVIQRAFRSVQRNLTAGARGYLKRKALREECEANTPYPDSATFLFVNENLRSMFADRPDSIASLDKYSQGRAQRARQWTTYRSAGGVKLLESPVAYLHSMRKTGNLFSEITARRAFNSAHPAQEIVGIGHIYRPIKHNMLENFSWLLGLAHHGIELVLTTPLDEQTAVRRSAPDDERSIEKNASALLREVVGLLQDDKYIVDEGDRGKKIFRPTSAARTATLQSFENGREKVREQVEALLDKHGLRIEALSEDDPKVEPAFDRNTFLNQLLMSDLHQADGGFPFLDTCLYARIELLPDQFGRMLDLLADPDRQDMQERAVHMLKLMINGLKFQSNTLRSLGCVAQALDRIENLDLQKSLFDCTHSKVASILPPAYRTRFLNSVAAHVARNALQEANIDGNGFRFLEHVAASRAVIHDYAWLPANVLAEPVYSKLNVIDALTAELCTNRDLANPAAAETVIAMIERLLTVSQSDRSAWLTGLAARLPLSRDPRREQVLWSFLLNARGDVSTPEQRQSLDTELARTVIMREVVRADFSPTRAIHDLAGLGLDPASWLTARVSHAIPKLSSAAQSNYINLIQACLDSMPVSDSRGRLAGLSALASTVEFLHDSLLVEEVLGRLAAERGGLADDDARRLSDRIISALLSRPWLDAKTVIEQLNNLGVPLDDNLFQYVIHRMLTVDDGHPDPEGPVQLAIALLEELPAASAQKFSLFAQLASGLRTMEYWNPTLALVDGLLANMRESGFNAEQEQQLERDIGDYLEHAFEAIANIHLALSFVPKWVEARPGMFSGLRLNLVKAQEIAEALAVLYEPTDDRWQDLMRVSEFLPHLPEDDLYEAVRQMLMQFEDASLNGIDEQTPDVRTDILTSIIDCIALDNALEERHLFNNLIRCINLGLDILSADDMANTLQHVIVQLSNPAVIDTPEAYSALLLLVEAKLAVITDNDIREKLLDLLLWLTQDENLLTQDLRAETLSAIARYSQAPEGSEG